MFFRRDNTLTSNRPRNGPKQSESAKLGFERLEGRELLAIMWVNQGVGGNNADNFDILGVDNREIGRAIVQRAVADWNAVITDQNVDNDDNPTTNNVFELTLNAADLLNDGLRGDATITQFTTGLPSDGQTGWTIDAPQKATVRVDDNAGGYGWFFDSTPNDDAEFTAIVNSGAGATGPAFQGSFIDVETMSSGYNDFYRTVVHEIGHAVGITANPDSALGSALVPIFSGGFRAFSRLTGDFLSLYDGATVDAIFGAGHLYEGPRTTPRQFYIDSPSVTFTEYGHPNELMNPGATVPADPPPGTVSGETTRQLISDLDARLLADAYGYSVVLPSDLNTAHVTLDSQTGTLLVHGGVTTQNFGQHDEITIDTVVEGGVTMVRVQVDDTSGNRPTMEKVRLDHVSQIVIAKYGGVDQIQVASSLEHLRKDVFYVVSTNQDSADAGILQDYIVDLDPAIPGAQIPLRAAIIELSSFGDVEPPGIYVPRGHYRFIAAGTGGTNQGDLDITENIVIIGTGAGETIIDAGGASGIGDRVFDVQGNASLSLDRVTVTGGYLATGPGAGVQVGDEADLTVVDSAFVGNNAATDAGGAIFRYLDGNTTIRRSVFTGNNAGTNGGAIRSNGTAGVLTIGESIFANNTAGTAGPNLHLGSGTFKVNEGNNLVDNTSNDAGFFSTSLGDYIGTANYVVTDLGDSYDGTTDLVQMSTRDAIGLANGTSAADEIWLPAWNFRLTEERTTPSNLAELDIADGDLEITQELTIRGVNGSTSVAWRAGAAVDKVFELLGDYNLNGAVDTADYVLWTNNDGDDDGTVGDQGDYDVWSNHYGNTLAVFGVS